jgi:hypothetical protein
MDIDQREKQVAKRLARVEKLEQDALAREKAARTQESTRKQVLLRLSPTLWQEIALWAEEDFRSINGQIEYLLAESVKRRKV